MTRCADPQRGRRPVLAAALCAFFLAPAEGRADFAADIAPNLLDYLIECALPAGEQVTIARDGGEESFAGSLGLAPAWRTRPLTEREQWWISACLLARTNLSGKRVGISMRAAEPTPEALTTTPEERAAFTFFEGGFFGNLFAPEPKAFVCGPDRTTEDATALVDRLCTVRPGSGARTLCGFTHVGPCPSEGDWPLIEVYLRPGDVALRAN